MDKQQIYQLLKSKNIWHEITEHIAVYNMAEFYGIDLPYPEADAKNLFVKDKGKNYYLLTIKGDKKADLKQFRERNSTRAVSFAPADALMEIMGLIPGAVSPFGLLNDSENRVNFFIDREFFEGDGLIGIHPNDNTATVWLKAADLVDIVREYGNTVTVAEF